MSIALDELRFSRTFSGGEPDFIELPSHPPATSRPLSEPGSHWTRQGPVRSAVTPQDRVTTHFRIRLDPGEEAEARSRRNRESFWKRVLIGFFTFERNTGYAISIVTHLFLLAVLALFLLGGSEPTSVRIESSFSQAAPSFSGVLDTELTLPETEVFHVPIVGDVESSGGAGLGRFFGEEGAEFFGLRAGGTDFVYVVDCSGSMQGAPFARARQQLLESINELKPDQRMYVMFYADAPFLMFNEPGPPAELIRATAENKERVRNWVQRIDADGGTRPAQPLKWALALDPDAVFLLTDGKFDDVVDDVTLANGGRARIHTIAFMNAAGEELLRRIADENGGTYRFVP